MPKASTRHGLAVTSPMPVAQAPNGGMRYGGRTLSWARACPSQRLQECTGVLHVLLVMWMVLPSQAGGLQGCQHGSARTLAENDLGTGSGWQQRRQNRALPAVAGHWARMACRDLCCAEGAPPQSVLFTPCLLGCGGGDYRSGRHHGPKLAKPRPTLGERARAEPRHCHGPCALHVASCRPQRGGGRGGGGRAAAVGLGGWAKNRRWRRAAAAARHGNTTHNKRAGAPRGDAPRHGHGGLRSGRGRVR